MKKNLIFLGILGLGLAGCDTSSPSDDHDLVGRVAFSFNTIEGTQPSEGRLAEIAAPAYLSYRLTDTDLETISETVVIHSSNGAFFTLPLSLPAGSYSLEEFVVLDNQHEVIYMAPLEDSPMADFVPQPLPLSFSVDANQTSEVTLHVLAVDGADPDEFGYSAYQFKPIQLRNLQVYGQQLGEAGGEFEYLLEIEGKDTATQVVWSKTYDMTSTQTITVPLGYDQYKATAYKDGFVPQVKYFRSDVFYSHLATIAYLTFELIPEDSDEVITLENEEGFRFYVSADPCKLWGRVEIPEEYAYQIDYIRWYQVAVNSEDTEYLGTVEGIALIGYPALMTNFDNIYEWERFFDGAENYCETYLNEEYRDQLELVTFEKGLLLDFDFEGTEFAFEDFDVHLIHSY